MLGRVFRGYSIDVGLVWNFGGGCQGILHEVCQPMGYGEVKYSLPIVFAPLRNSRSAWSQ